MEKSLENPHERVLSTKPLQRLFQTLFIVGCLYITAKRLKYFIFSFSKKEKIFKFKYLSQPHSSKFGGRVLMQKYFTQNVSSIFIFKHYILMHCSLELIFRRLDFFMIRMGHTPCTVAETACDADLCY